MRSPGMATRLIAVLSLLLAALPATAQPRGEPESRAMAGMLAAHNAARHDAGVPPLGWSGALAASAQRWADTLRGRGCSLRHSGAAGVGENLAWASGQSLSPAQVVAMWVGERRAFNAARNTCAPGAVCGHYTQVVWRDTKQVGCGLASCGSSEIWVCQYAPPGNVVGQRPF